MEMVKMMAPPPRMPPRLLSPIINDREIWRNNNTNNNNNGKKIIMIIMHGALVLEWPRALHAKCANDRGPWDRRYYTWSAQVPRTDPIRSVAGQCGNAKLIYGSQSPKIDWWWWRREAWVVLWVYGVCIWE